MNSRKLPNGLPAFLAIAAAALVAAHAAWHGLPTNTLVWRTAFTLLSAGITQWNLVAAWEAVSQQADAAGAVPSPARAR